MTPQAISCRSVVSRHYARAPRLIVIPAKDVARWNLTATTVVNATICGVNVGRRTIKRWDADRWWIDVPDPICRKLQVDVGSAVDVELTLADATPPAELLTLLDIPKARRQWEALTDAQRRMLAEHVAVAKQSSTRERRARQGLLGSVGGV